MSNLYEVRKTVRFELIPQFKIPRVLKLNDLDENVQHFISQYEKLIGNFINIVFDPTRTRLNQKLKIKFSFLRTYTKREYYENGIEQFKKGNNQIEIGNTKKLMYLFDIFQNFEKNNKYFLEQVTEIGGRNAENKARKSDLAYWFHQISKKTNFDFIKELFNDNLNIENKLSEKIEESKKLTQNLQELILIIEKDLLSSQSMGQVIEKASFNYYTVNKKPKDYERDKEYYESLKFKTLFFFNTKIKYEKRFLMNDKGKEEKSIVDDFMKSIISKTDSFGKESYFNPKERKVVEKENIGSDYLSLKIENAYNLMKEYKAKQKSNFLEYLNEKAKGNKSDLDVSLFNDIFKTSQFQEILNFTKAILLLSQVKTDVINLKDTINKEKKDAEIEANLETYNTKFGSDFGKIERESFFEKITELKKGRGQYFFEGNKEGKFEFKKYGNFCSEYKKVAMQYGNIKASIKALEKEKVDAEKTDSWALILENNDNRFLLTIPRNQIFHAKRIIDNLKDENGNLVLHRFESLTLRALSKLCFGKENNTFRSTLYPHITDGKFLNSKGKLKDKFEFSKELNDEKIPDDKLLLDFYITVLKLKSTQQQIVIKYFTGFDEFTKKDFESLDEFEQELKKVCYVRQTIGISEQTKNNLLENYDAKLYKITSYDLKKYDSEVLEKLTNKKGLDRSGLKVNTKIWLDFWRESNEDAHFPLRLNPEIKISFVEKEKEFIQNHSELPFNRKFHDRFLLTSSFTENALHKGIDLNFKETKEILNFYNHYNQQFNNEKKDTLKYFYGLDRGENELVSLGFFDFSKEKNEDKGVKIKVYELKKDFFEKADEKGRLPYKNISYFTDEKYNNYFAEKEVSCIDLTKAKLIKGKIYINGDIITYENLKQVAENRKKDEISIQKVNNLRDAICANAVGIITFLQETYPGMICFEDMNTKSKNNLFEKNNTTLGSRIEEKLLQKFASLNQVPPQYKQVFTLQDDKKINQLGIIWYVDIGGTSNSCPICGKKLFGHGKGPDFEPNMHHYKENNGVDYGICLEEARKTENINCDYHMKNNNYGCDFIKSGDDLATYNIAKKGLEYIKGLESMT